MSGSRGRSFLVLCPRRASTQSSRRRGVVVGVSFSTPSTSARSSPRPLPLRGEGRAGVGLFFSSPWRGKCRVFEAMGVRARWVEVSLHERGRPKRLGCFPCVGKEGLGSVFYLRPPGGGSAESSRRWGCWRAGWKILYPIDLGSFLASATSPARGRKETPSPSLRSVTSPARGRKSWGRSFLCFPLEGEVPSLRGDGGVVAKSFYPIDLGQSASATSPARGRKKWGRSSPRPLPLRGEARK